MPQLLVNIKNRTNPDSTISDTLAKVGDVIYVAGDEHVWGTHEDKREWIKKYGTEEGWPADYVIVKVNGISITHLKKLTDMLYRDAVEGEAEYNASDEADRKVFLAKRAWKIVTSKISQQKLNNIIKAGYAEFNFTDIDFEVRHKLTNLKLRG